MEVEFKVNKSALEQNVELLKLDPYLNKTFLSKVSGKDGDIHEIDQNRNLKNSRKGRVNKANDGQRQKLSSRAGNSN